MHFACLFCNLHSPPPLHLFFFFLNDPPPPEFSPLPLPDPLPFSVAFRGARAPGPPSPVPKGWVRPRRSDADETEPSTAPKVSQTPREREAFAGLNQPGPAVTFDIADDLATDPVHGPDNDDGAGVRPETVDREVRRDPRRERHHSDVDYEVEKTERHDDQRERENRQDRLEERVGDTE